MLAGTEVEPRALPRVLIAEDGSERNVSHGGSSDERVFDDVSVVEDGGSVSNVSDYKIRIKPIDSRLRLHFKKMKVRILSLADSLSVRCIFTVWSEMIKNVCARAHHV